MRKERMEHFRYELLQVREDLLLELRKKVSEAAELRDEGVADLADAGLTDHLKDFLYLLSDSKREEIAKIDDALERLERGTYGTCQECGDTISPERLEVRPHTRFCRACKEEFEESVAEKAGPGPARGTL